MPDFHLVLICRLRNGGFGGIAQAIVVRSILGQTTEADYFCWIVPLALPGHVSGGLVSMGVSPITSQFFPQA